MADGNHQHDKMTVLNRGNNTIVPDPLAPKPPAVTCQCVTETTRIGRSGNTFTQISQYDAFSVGAKLAQVSGSRTVELDAPARHCQALSRFALLVLPFKALERNARTTARQPRVCEIIVLDVFDLPYNCLAGVKTLGSPGLFGECIKTPFDSRRQTEGEHLVNSCVAIHV
jgi:hypothetical protein